jgi:lipoyl(octanoyl) transferase
MGRRSTRGGSGMTTVQTITAEVTTAPGAHASDIRVRQLGLVDYEPTWRAMRELTAARTPETPDEIWMLEHPPVYTLGVAGRSEHLPRGANAIPVIKVDRGGQITFHGPGQVVLYLLLDMRRRGLTVRPLVRIMERAVINLLAAHGIAAEARTEAPGVYVKGAKIAALGLRVRKGCCYHGLAFNVDMDLSPFHAVDPCGYPGLAVTQARDLGISGSVERLGEELVHHVLNCLP